MNAIWDLYARGLLTEAEYDVACARCEVAGHPPARLEHVLPCSNDCRAETGRGLVVCPDCGHEEYRDVQRVPGSHCWEVVA